MSDKDESRYTFIRDVPTADDQLRSHGALARDIAMAIRDNPTIQTIGLLGPWGSGKSTVLRLLRDMLTSGVIQLKTAGQRPLNARLFLFDAWLPQGEPPRKAFLRSMLEAGEFKDAFDRTHHAKVDLVTGKVTVTETTETPRLTPGAKVILVAIAVWAALAAGNAGLADIPGVPTVLSFLRDHLPAWAVGLLVPAIPVAATISVMGARWLARRRLAKSPAALPGDEVPDEPLFPLFMNRQHQSRRTRITGAASPTAADFQGVFAQLLEAVQGDHSRLVIIIDNLDRLPDAEAREVWTMLRAFAPDGLADGPTTTPGACMIAAVAADSLATLYTGTTAAGPRVEGFLQKTFDIVFSVPPPVLGQWQDLLGQQLHYVFGSDLERDDVERIWQLADAYWNGAEVTITPRRINALVNGMRAKRGHDSARWVPLPVVAYYCLHQANVEADIYAALRSDVAGFAGDADDWRAGMAALYYGLSTEHASIVLVDGALDRMFASGSVDAYGSALAIRGADTLALRHLAKLATRGSCSWREVFVAANLITHRRLFSVTQAASGTDYLRRMLRAKPSAFNDEEFDFSVLRRVITKSPERRVNLLLTDLNSALGSLPDDVDSLGPRIALFWRETLELSPGANFSDSIHVPGGAKAFVIAASRVTDSPVLSRLRTEAAAIDIEEQLLEDVADDKVTALHPDKSRVELETQAEDAYGRLKAVWATGVLKALPTYELRAVQRISTVGRMKLAGFADIVALRAPLLALALALVAGNSNAGVGLIKGLSDRGEFRPLVDAMVASECHAVLGQFIGLCLGLGFWPANALGLDYEAQPVWAARLILANLEETVELIMPEAHLADSWQALFTPPDDDDPLQVRTLLRGIDARRAHRAAGG